MMKLFSEEIAKGWLLVYVDDLLLATKTADEHQTALEVIFHKLARYGEQLNLSKMRVGIPYASFLGYIITRPCRN